MAKDDAALTAKVESLERVVAALEQTMNHSMHVGSVSLREYVDTRFTEQDRKVVQARDELERRLDILNGEREQLRDRDATFVTIPVFVAFQEKVGEFMIEIRGFRDTLQGKADQSSMTYTWIVSGVTLILSIAALIVSIMKLSG
jgi:hypothetical protein